MKSSLDSPTKKEREWMRIIKQEIGCIACRKDGNMDVPASAHHILCGGIRMGHMETIPLCYQHHLGSEGIHRAKRRFHERYGSNDQLLAETRLLVAELKANTIGTL